MSIRLPRLLPGHRRRGGPLAELIGTLVLVGASSVSATAQTGYRSGAEPTIVLVHGAFADASSWNGVLERLQADGYTVVAPANPLRGTAADTAYLQSVLAQISG